MKFIKHVSDKITKEKKRWFIKNVLVKFIKVFDEINKMLIVIFFNFLNWNNKILK